MLKPDIYLVGYLSAQNKYHGKFECHLLTFLVKKNQHCCTQKTKQGKSRHHRVPNMDWGILKHYCCHFDQAIFHHKNEKNRPT